MGRTRKYTDHLHTSLQDSKEVAAYLNAALDDPDPHVFLLALRDIADAQGGIGRLADETQLNRESLYRTLSMRGNPRFSSLRAVLEAFGVYLSVKPQ